MPRTGSAGWLGYAAEPRVRLLLFFVLTWLGVALLLTFLLREGHREAERKATAEALVVSALLEVRLEATLQRVQSEMAHAAQMVPNAAFHQAGVLRFRDVLARDIAAYLHRTREIGGFSILDAQGQALFASSADLPGGLVGNPGFVANAQSSQDQTLRFSPVYRDPVSQRSWLAVAYPVHAPTGERRGWIVARLDLDQLSHIFDTVAVGAQGVIAIRRSDDQWLVLRRPARPDLVNQPAVDKQLQQALSQGLTHGTIRFWAKMDGVDRIYGFQRIAGYPLYVLVGLATSDYLSEWRQTFVIAGVAGTLLFLALTLVLLRLLRAGSKEEAAARKLMESEARYRMLAENSHDVIWTLDIPTRRYTYVSPSVVGMAGYQPQEMIGQSLDVTLTPESAASMAAEIEHRLRRLAAGDSSASVDVCELEQICKDGQVISTEVVSSYLPDADAVVRTILGITRNVSERRAADLALRETNRQLQARIDEIGRLQVALQELAVRDGLTGLYNRRYLDETLDREVSRARREGHPLALVMLDIDHFKRVNDTYGHQVGDEVLRLLANTLLAGVRAEDVVCRYGGEEFLILLPNMPLDIAVLRAEAWRRAVEALSVTLGEFQISFSISLGVAAYPEHGKTPDDLTRCVDQALYRAKREGRNQVYVYAD